MPPLHFSERFRQPPAKEQPQLPSLEGKFFYDDPRRIEQKVEQISQELCNKKQGSERCQNRHFSFLKWYDIKESLLKSR